MKTPRLLALACAASLLCTPLAVLANDGAAPLGDGRSIVLAQIAQPKKGARACAAGVIYCCKTYKKQEYCGCNCGKKLIGKPQTLVP